MMQPELAFLVAAILLIGIVDADWTGPVLLVNDSSYVTVQSTYRDPATMASHVLLYNTSSRLILHLALSNSGSIVHRNVLGKTSLYPAILRGAGDGKRLFVAMAYSNGSSEVERINFTESESGGKTWTKAANILLDGRSNTLQDMIFVAETGRVFVFLQNEDKEIRVTSRAPGSRAFSAPILVAGVNYYYTSCHFARATYSLVSGKPMLHVLFMGDTIQGRIYYVRSKDNGVTWSAPRPIFSTRNGVVRIAGAATVGQRIFVLQGSSSWGDHPRMMYSDDNGMTFKQKELGITTSTSAGTDLTVCQSKGKSAMASLILSSYDTVYYSLWNTTSVEQTQKEYVISGKDFHSTGLDCTVDTERSLMHVTTVVELRLRKGRSLVYFARDSSPFPK